uniref:MSP domain-containing protein n=1 Tax=Panagrolaimus sp. JU765 TaxID=591449 RepID=A0AC34RC24_9BILA
QFPLDDLNSQNQTFTLFNPYEFSVKFKILATAPNKYKLNTTHGVINGKHYVDLMVRHLAVSLNEIGSSDFLRIEIIKDGEILGTKDIQLSVVSQSNRPYNLESTMFRSFPSSASMQSSETLSQRGNKQRRVTFIPGTSSDQRQSLNPPDNRLLNAFIFFLLLICGATVIIPTFDGNLTEPRTNEGFFGRIVPVNSRPTISQQLLASCTFGA